MHIDMSRAYFHAKAQRLVLVRFLVEDRMGADAGHTGQLKKTMHGTRDAASNWERDSQEHVKNWVFQLGISSKNLFRQESQQVSGMTHGDDFVLTEARERLTEFENKMTGMYPIQAKLSSEMRTIQCVCYNETKVTRRHPWYSFALGGLVCDCLLSNTVWRALRCSDFHQYLLPSLSLPLTCLVV